MNRPILTLLPCFLIACAGGDANDTGPSCTAEDPGQLLGTVYWGSEVSSDNLAANVNVDMWSRTANESREDAITSITNEEGTFMVQVVGGMWAFYAYTSDGMSFSSDPAVHEVIPCQENQVSIFLDTGFGR